MKDTEVLKAFQDQAILAQAEYRGGEFVQRKGVSPKSGAWEINEITHNVEIKGKPKTFVQRIPKEEVAKHDLSKPFPLPARKGETVLLQFDLNEAEKGTYYVDCVVHPIVPTVGK